MYLFFNFVNIVTSADCDKLRFCLEKCQLSVKYIILILNIYRKGINWSLCPITS